MQSKQKNIFLFNFLLVIILIIGFLIRVWNLDKNPAGFFCDEASIGYNAYSILKTGKDEWRARFPLLFKAFGEYKNPVMIYSTVPFVKLFGLNEWSVRLTAVIYGTLAIYSIYLLSKTLFSYQVAVWAALFLAIAPWHIHFSQTAFELIASTFWVPMFLYFFLKTTKDFSRYYLFTVITFFISFFTYYPVKIYLPLLTVGIFFIYFDKTKFWLNQKKFWLINFLVIVFFLFTMFPYLFNRAYLSRWDQVKNERLFTSFKIIEAYFNHFSYDFLFRKGDIDFPGQFITRHSVRGMGQLYLWQLPFLILTIIYIFHRNNETRKKLLFLLFFLIIYPMGSIFTSVNPQASRSVIGIIPFTLITAFGVHKVFSFFKKRYSKIVFFLALFFFITVAFLKYIGLKKHYPFYSSDFWGWQYGPKEIISYFLANKNKYDELYMSGEFNGTEIFLKFYDPENKCQDKCMIGDFFRQPEIYQPGIRQLFSLSPEYLKKSKFKDRFKIRKIIYYPNGKEAFYIGELK